MDRSGSPVTETRPRFVDLFAGCGGLSLGLHNAGWHGVFCVEKNAMAFETLQHNLLSKNGYYSWPTWLPQRHYTLRTLLQNYAQQLAELAGTVDLVAGGPPCQGFSTAGRRRKDDERNRLVYDYLKAVELIQPRMIFFENVRGFTLRFGSDKKHQRVYSDTVLNRLKSLGYSDVQGELLDLSQFGVPQRRKRFIIVGSRDGIASNYFQDLREKLPAFLKSKKIPRDNSAADAISDLRLTFGLAPCPDFPRYNSGKYGRIGSQYQKLMRNGAPAGMIPNSHRFAHHRVDVTEVFNRLVIEAPKNENLAGERLRVFGLKKRSVTVLDPDGTSPTITSIPDDYLHYSEPRILTARECARLQTFPDSFEFCGKYTSGGKERRGEVPRFTQIGNAVPPLFAELAGNVLKELLADA